MRDKVDGPRVYEEDLLNEAPKETGNWYKQMTGEKEPEWNYGESPVFMVTTTTGACIFQGFDDCYDFMVKHLLFQCHVLFWNKEIFGWKYKATLQLLDEVRG